jgi:hypothetical protein
MRTVSTCPRKRTIRPPLRATAKGHGFAATGPYGAPDARPGRRVRADSRRWPRFRPALLSTGRRLIPRTLLTPDSDSADATRGYPPDSTDDSNSLVQIAFD